MTYQYEILNDEYRFQEFLKDLFNNIWNTNTFEEYGSKGNSQYGVDVYSANLRIVVQAKKKDNLRSAKTLKTELLKELKETVADIEKFPHTVDTVYFAATTPKYIEVQNEAMALSKSTGKSIHFFSWTDIQKEISKYPELRKKYYPHLETTTTPKELVSTSHIDAISVLGRDNDILRLDELLSENQIIAVQSIGGVGKTTFAKLLYQLKIDQYDHLIWLDYLSDYKKDISYNESLVDNLSINFNDSDTTQRRYEKVVNRIVSLPGKILIIIDNLQHEKSGSVEIEIAKLVSNKQVNIVVISTQPFSNFASLQLGPVDKTSAKEIFRRNCPKAIDDARLEELIEMVESNALLIELLGRRYTMILGYQLDK